MSEIRIGDLVRYCSSYTSFRYCVVAGLTENPHSRTEQVWGVWCDSEEEALLVTPRASTYVLFRQCELVSRRVPLGDEIPEAVTCLAHFFRKYK